MISLETYKVLHILGVLLAFASLGGLTLTVANGAAKSTSSVRRLITISHGVSTTVILLCGFGALARLDPVLRRAVDFEVFQPALRALDLEPVTFPRRPGL